jgi:protein PhnA
MSPIQELQKRSDSTCELCAGGDDLGAFAVAPHSSGGAEHNVLACGVCRAQLADHGSIDENHWRCLSDSMWSEVEAVKVVAWRMLTRLGDRDWARALLDMLYIEEELLAWAKSGMESSLSAGPALKHLDSNGALLETGDTVTLTKDLNVKGANFVAKRGTAVRNIMVVDDNAEHIEGKVSGQRIVILTKFVRKAN